MPIHNLALYQFRNFSEIHLEPTVNGANLLYGANGTGKTSILEAIYYLSHGRSFRTPQAIKMIADKHSSLIIQSELKISENVSYFTAIEKKRNNEQRIRFEGETYSNLLPIMRQLPVRIIHNQSFMLLDGGPSIRRKYIDWGLFYLQASFWDTWIGYERALKQRNHLLKIRASTANIMPWSLELMRLGTMLHTYRRNYLTAITPAINHHLKLVLPDHVFELNYDCGWSAELPLISALEQAQAKDYQYGFTTVGPHRAELSFISDNILAKHYLSRGQQKLFVCALYLAQSYHAMMHNNLKIVLLIDDISAELDIFNQQLLLTILGTFQTQLFITTVDQNIEKFLPNSLADSSKMFHVEHLNKI